MTMPAVLFEQHDGVALVTLNRPERRNALSRDLCLGLLDHLRTIAASDCKVMMLRGAGGDFSVGADLNAGPAAIGGKTADGTTSAAFQVPAVLHAMPQITIAAIDGGCAGGALGWAAACDLRFASNRARMATAFLKVGMPGDMGLIWSLMRIVGPARAREMLFLPDRFGAAQALEWGLVSRVFKAETFEKDVVDVAETIALAPARALRAMKANVLAAEQLPFDAYCEIETARHVELSGTLARAANPSRK